GPKRALITGITGQDGSYLSELLLDRGYDVHGLVRRETAASPCCRLAGIQSRLTFHAVSLEAYADVAGAVRAVRPEECYHLAARSFFSAAVEDEAATLRTNIQGTHALLAAIQAEAPACRVFYAGSSEVFGLAAEEPQTERTQFQPRSVYG